MKKAKVDFLMIGAPKCGTTWFYNIFMQHPDIYVPDVKDIYYFDEHYEKGNQWFESYFKAKKQNQKAVELSHNYLYSVTALKRIYEYNPNIKILISLREPVKRALSQYKFMIKDGLLSNDIDDMDSEYIKFIIDWSRYSKYIKTVQEIFPEEQIEIIIFEEFTLHKRKNIFELLTFLDVTPDFYHSSFENKSLESTSARNRKLALLAKKSSMALRKSGFLNLLGILKHSKIIRKILYSNKKYDVNEQMISYINQQLKDEIHAIEKLGIDCKIWSKRE
jgi:hypothetical protein